MSPSTYIELQRMLAALEFEMRPGQPRCSQCPHCAHRYRLIGAIRTLLQMDGVSTEPLMRVYR